MEPSKQRGEFLVDIYLVHKMMPRVYLGVKTCEVFLCFEAVVRVRVCYVDVLFSLFYVAAECYRFLHRG